MSNDGLKKVYLIKSAGYEFAEINLSDNTLLLGESGVGKTTIMRAVLFFYTMDYSDALLNINPDTKKSFNQWYFKEHNSHVVYNYIKDGREFLFVVSRGAKLYYTFIDITNTTLGVKELFLDANMPLSLEQLQERIQQNNLVNYVTTNKEKYIYALHNKDEYGKKIKQESPISFVLFESMNSRKEFAKTLSNIFANSKVSSHSIKRSIVSLVDDAGAKINLNEIKIRLNEFLAEKVEIENFEQKIPTIELLAQTHNSYKESKKEFKVLATKLESLKQNAQLKIEEQKRTLDEVAEQKEVVQQTFSLKIEVSKNGISELQNKLSINSNEIEKLTQKQKYYEKKNITFLEEEFLKQSEYETQLQSAKERFEVLTSDSHNLKQRYEILQLQLQQNFEKSLQELGLQTEKKQLVANQSINEIIQSQEKKVALASLKYKEQKEQFSQKLLKLKTEFETTKISLAKLEHFSFNKENIAHYEKEIKQFEQEILTTKRSLDENSFEIKKVEEELKSIELTLKQQTQKVDENATKAKEALFEKKSALEKKLDFESANLYGYLNKNNVKNKEKIITYLKDEILFSQKEFHVKEGEVSESIFGVEIAFEEEFEDKYHQRKLTQELETIKEKIKTLNKTTTAQKRKLQDEATLQTKEKNRQRSLFYAKKAELEEFLHTYTKSIEVAKQSLNEAHQQAQEQKKQEVQQLQKLYVEQEHTIKTTKDEINKVQKKLEEIYEHIVASHKDDIATLNKEIQELQEKKVQQTQEIKERFKQEKKVLEEELKTALLQEGVDDTLLKSISKEIQSLETKLKNIEKTRVDVTVYIAEYKDEIGKLPKKQKQLQSDEKTLAELQTELKNLKVEAKKELAKIDEAQQSLIEEKKNLEKFLDNYEQKIASQSIAKTIQNNITPLDENKLFLREDVSEIVDDVVALYDKIKSDEQKIKGYVLECLQVLKYDNIFKIEVERDYIDSTLYLKTAKELISYVQNDKLSIFKDISSESFKSSLNYIKKELSNFEDALYDVESEVLNLRNTINKAVHSFNVIDSIKMRFESSNHEILNALRELSEFYDNNSDKFLSGLFSSLENEKVTLKAKIDLSAKISELSDLLKVAPTSIELENGFVLEFKVSENGNDLKWRQTLNDIGSNGTSTLVKSIINISMLQMVSKNIVKEKSIVAHCILDEIGTISTDYFKELKDFVNRSGFVFLNGMPIEDDMLISMYPTIYVGQKNGNRSRMILASKM